LSVYMFIFIVLYCFIFFFQAEDGIRDRNVTGVQTCALPIYFKQIESNYGMEIIYHSSLDAQRFDNEIETVVYRVVQEALFNAIKYANVDKVEIDLHYNRNRLIAEVVDRGIGFIKTDQPQGTGLGIYGMYERAELVNAEVNVDSQIGRGTIVTLEVPI